ncbi:MAG: hypothetical protein V2I43_04690, partial [Parvularcula sp.]|nr:hypothetical protein [Parvularcula sp.]
PDKTDRRSRLVQITGEGVALLEAALPTWRETHARLDAALSDGAPDRLRADLRQVPPVAAAVAVSGEGQISE